MKTVFSSVNALLVAMVFLAGCRANIPTGLSLISQRNPPVFKLSGNSYFLTFKVTGPFPNLHELQNDTGKVDIWDINTSTTSDSHTPIANLPQITYGVTPSEFSQFFPRNDQKPEALEPGKFYRSKAIATHAKSDGRGGWIWEHSEVCFTVIASGVDEVPCIEPGKGGYGPGKSPTK